MRRLPVGILLAAGQSRRFGANKMLHPLDDNSTMLMRSAQTLASVLPASIVVINPELAGQAAQLEQLGMRVVVNPQARQGMGSSIACGMQASPDAAGWFIVLADMPYIKADTIRQLAASLKTDSSIVAPRYDQQRGHPVGFGRCYRDALLALNDDVGARHVIASHQQQLELIPVDDVGVITDIDVHGDIRSATN